MLNIGDPVLVAHRRLFAEDQPRFAGKKSPEEAGRAAGWLRQLLRRFGHAGSVLCLAGPRLEM